MYTVYVLFSDNYNRTYTGLTNNLERRIKEHNSGQSKSTKAFMPWRIVHEEVFETRQDA